jgi:hypothetical protein
MDTLLKMALPSTQVQEALASTGNGAWRRMVADGRAGVSSDAGPPHDTRGNPWIDFKKPCSVKSSLMRPENDCKRHGTHHWPKASLGMSAWSKHHRI